MHTDDLPCAPLEFHLILPDMCSAGILEQFIRARNRAGLGIFKSLKIPYQNDLEHGNGTFLWTDGYKYSGGWELGIKSGYGEYFYNNGDVYRGMVSF